MTLVRRNLPAIRDAEMGAASFVPHVDLEAVLRLIAAAAEAHPRTGERDGPLIALLFDAGLRVSEGINLRPKDLSRTNAGAWAATVTGKGNKTAQVAVSSSLVDNLQNHTPTGPSCRRGSAPFRSYGPGSIRLCGKPLKPPALPSRSMWARSTS